MNQGFISPWKVMCQLPNVLFAYVVSKQMVNSYLRWFEEPSSHLASFAIGFVTTHGLGPLGRWFIFTGYKRYKIQKEDNPKTHGFMTFINQSQVIHHKWHKRCSLNWDYWTTRRAPRISFLKSGLLLIDLQAMMLRLHSSCVHKAHLAFGFFNARILLEISLVNQW